MSNEYFIERKKRIITIDFFICDMRLTQIPIFLEHEGIKLETTYSINVWILTGGLTKVNPDLPPLLYGTRNSYQIEYYNRPEIEMLFTEAEFFDNIKWTEDNRAEIILVEKMKIEQLELAENKENRWMVYSPDKFPSTINMILKKMDQEMRG